MFSSKKIYCVLLSEHSSPPVLPFVWQNRLVPNLSLRTLWQNIRDGFTENFKSDVAWLISLRAVTVRDTLKSWGYLSSDQCSSCPRRETIDHCFLNCWRIKQVWTFFSPFLSRFVKTPFIRNVLYVFLYQWEPIDARHHRILLFLVKTIVYAAWRFRSRAVFRNIHDNSFPPKSSATSTRRKAMLRAPVFSPGFAASLCSRWQQMKPKLLMWRAL